MSGQKNVGAGAGWVARVLGAFAGIGLVAAVSVVALTRCGDDPYESGETGTSERVVVQSCVSSEDCPFPLTCLQYSGTTSYCTSVCIDLKDECGGGGNCCLQALDGKYCAPKTICDLQIIDTDTGGTTGETDGAETDGETDTSETGETDGAGDTGDTDTDTTTSTTDGDETDGAVTE